MWASAKRLRLEGYRAIIELLATKQPLAGAEPPSRQAARPCRWGGRPRVAPGTAGTGPEGASTATEFSQARWPPPPGLAALIRTGEAG